MTSGSAVYGGGLAPDGCANAQMSDARVLPHDRRGTHFWPHRAQPFPSSTVRGLLHRPAPAGTALSAAVLW